MNGPISQTASWRAEFYLNVTSPYDAPGGDGWYIAGSTAHATLANGNASGGTGIRYVFTGWSGDASGTGLTSDAITMNSPKAAVANWKTQYYLKVNNGGYGAASGEGWYDSGTPATFSINPTIIGEGEGKRYVFTYWSGASTSTNPSDNILMNEPKTVTANWKTQYQVTLGETGLDSAATGTVVTVGGSAKTSSDLPFGMWVDSGSSVTYTYADLVNSSVSGSRFKLSSVTGPVSSITISGDTLVTGSYKITYYLNIVSPQGTSDGAGWYDSGATAYVKLNQSIVNASSDVRYVFAGWTGDASGATLTSNPIIVNSSMSAVASWKKQFLVVFDQNGLQNGFEANIELKSVNQTLPYSIWIDEGAVVQFAYQDKLPIGFGRQYFLTSTSNKSPLNVESPITVTAQYTLQYTIEMYVAIAIPAVLAVLAIGIVLLKRRKKT
jgi:uncharacterized repeat protein (TIGR02543 family)